MTQQMKEAQNIKSEPDELNRVKLLLALMDGASKVCSQVSNAIEKNDPKEEDEEMEWKGDETETGPTTKNDYNGNVI